MLKFTHLTRFAVAASIGVGLAAASGSAAWAKDGRQADSDTQQYTVKKMADGTVEYCTQLPAVTGSRIQPTVCKTAKDWKKVGVVINAR
jgi:hypothetical protein